ncbi:MAG: FapA family protein, partial [Sulfuricurvum sp.]|nr:FapA family protein [Sulfuricurvum sp.]
NKKMLRLGFLIGMADEQLDVDINRLLSYIQKQGPLSEPYNLIIAQFFPEIPTVNDAIVLHYKERDKKKSLIEGVNPKELLLEYIFPKQGRNGRGCDGVIIVVPEPKVKYDKSIKIDDETIYTVEDERSIRYYAKISGFVKFERGHLSISQALSLKSLSLKKTGSIDVGGDKQITLELNQKVYREDAVGMGVSIDIQKVDIIGTVGENTRIKADELTIGAQTHRKSTMEVSGVANIQLHRGNLKAKEANIDMLEGGRVEADIVHINKMLGGEVIGRKVYVDILYSHAKIIALESIEVNTIAGEGNALIIDPDSVSAYHEKIAQVKATVAEKESSYQFLKKELTDKQLGFKQKNMQINQFKHRIARAKANGLEPVSVEMVRIREYEAQGHKLHLEEGRLREEAQYIAALHDKLNKLYEADLQGVILCHDVYNGHNRVAFVDPKTRREYALFPRGAVRKIILELHGDEKKIGLEY